MKNLSRKEALEILNGMKVKIKIPKAAVMQNKRNAALDMAIEALKYSEILNSSTDCISRQAAIDAFHTWFRDGFDEDKWWNSTHVLAAIEGLPSAQQGYKWETCFECPLSHGCPKIKGCTNGQAIEYASQMPNDCPLSVQPEQHWIPCGERLPEEKQSVLVTDGSVVWVCDIISTDEGYKWEDSHGYWLDLDEWTAWMPLPKPTGGDME